MFTQSATHRGAPFVGRTREIGILTHLIQEGLSGSYALVRVTGEAGMGRRRVIAEALSHGPDAEWIHLAPGGVRADLRRWTRTELIDLLETYPHVRFPSWALHVLAHWAPGLARRAAVPAASRERLDPREAPEILGGAIGAILQALTGQTLIIVEAGIWPSDGTPQARLLRSLVRALGVPGALVLAAAGPEEPGRLDPEGTRTVRLGPLRPWQVEELLSLWFEEIEDRLAGWLWRVTNGHPFFLHETMRWLEEMGHVRVDEDHKRMELLAPVLRFPVPLYLRSVMEARYQRLPLGAARLLHLLTMNDGRLEVEALRRLYNGEGEVFDEALAALRRREFLLHRTARRPLATASPTWEKIVSAGVARFPRHAYRPPRVSVPKVRVPVSALGRALRRLDVLRGPAKPSPGEFHTELAAIRRLVKGRRGPAWDGVRGRLAVLAARARLSEGRPASSTLWVTWGREHLPPDRHPALRRALSRVQVEVMERGGETARALEERSQTRREALRAGHFLAAARIRGPQAEAKRRLGEVEEAARDAREAEEELLRIGLPGDARLARITRIRALLDARRLDKAEEVLETQLGRDDPAHREIQGRLEGLRASPPVPLQKPRPEPVSGWGWGLDGHDVWQSSLETVAWAWRTGKKDGAHVLERTLQEPLNRARARGHLTALADLTEIRLWAWTREDRPQTWNCLLEEAAEQNRRIGSLPRARFLAQALRVSPAITQPAYTAHFHPFLVNSVPPRVEAGEIAVRLHLLGHPRVVRPRGVWPRSIWPEWWQRLWSLAMIRDFQEESLPRLLVQRWLGEAHDTPKESLEAVLHRGNLLLYGGERPAGGLHLREDQVVVEWGGIWCDLHALGDRWMESRQHAENRDVTAARRSRRLGLGLLCGDLLPGDDHSVVAEVRGRVREVAKQMLVAELEGDEAIPTEDLLQWMEGAFSVAGLSGELARFRGKPSLGGAPFLLPPGSP